MPSLQFIWMMLCQYEILLCVFPSLAFLFYLWPARPKRKVFFVISISMIVPFLIIAFSNFKIERYAYPGYIGMFALAGCGISLIWVLPRAIAICLTILLLAIPWGKTALVYQFLPAEFAPHISRVTTQLGFARYPWEPARQADSRDWKIKELAQVVEKAKRVEGPIFLLGESTAYHPNLMIFVALTNRYNQRWVTFPHHSHPQMTASDLLKCLREEKPSVVLFKSPPYVLDFLARYLDEASSELSRSSEYIRSEASVTQPDGAKFTIFSRVPPKG